jgi:cysteine synthase
MESFNPSGSGKDRAVQAMLDQCERKYSLVQLQNIVEGTSGSTGIALAYQCRARGYRLHIVMPDDQAEEKRIMLEKLGAIVHITKSCAIANSQHYVNRARRLAEELNGVFLNQFENLDNMQVHYEITGPELLQQFHQLVQQEQDDEEKYSNDNSNNNSNIWKKWKERLLSLSSSSSSSTSLDAFVMSSGTGGTIAGISKYLQENSPSTKIILADPYGSSLHHKVQYNTCYTIQQSERQLRKHRYDSIVEGVGLDRLTANFLSTPKIHDSYQISDQEIVNTAHWILDQEGLLIGSSTALNLAATIRYAMKLPENASLITIVCDSGQRHLSRLWNPIYCQDHYNIVWPTNKTEENYGQNLRKLLSVFQDT